MKDGMRQVSLEELAAEFSVPAVEDPQIAAVEEVPRVTPSNRKLPADPRRQFRKAGEQIPQNLWPTCPDGMLATPVHTFLPMFEGEVWAGSKSSPRDTHIAFPANCFPHRDPMSQHSALLSATAREHGWHVVTGLAPNDLPSYTGGYTLTVPHKGKCLIPPPGLWLHTLPQQVRSGEVDVSEDNGWFDIFDVNVGYLAWSDNATLARQGWQHGDGYHYVTIPAKGKWWFHGSLPGLRELLEKMYPEQHRVEADVSRATLYLEVPKTDVGRWIGCEGRMVKNLSQWIGWPTIRISAFR
ncbi:MAG TPA: hypothetical protein VGE59_02495 [Patescibacteria group bacterium]